MTNEKKIPKILHQIWWQGPSFPEKYEKGFQSWSKFNPNWKHMLWSEKGLTELVSTAFPEFYRDTWSQLPKMIQKIDAAKPVILWVYGGIYLDMDMECMSPIESMLNPDTTELFLSRMNLNQKIAKLCRLFRVTNFANSQINNACFGMYRHHPLCLAILDGIQKATRSRRKGFAKLSDTMYVMVTTGPEVYATAILDYLKANKKEQDNQKILVYPFDVWECDSTERFVPGKTIAYHHSEATWSPLGAAGKHVAKNRPLYYGFGFALIVLVLLIVIFIAIWISSSSKATKKSNNKQDEDKEKLVATDDPQSITMQRQQTFISVQ